MGVGALAGEGAASCDSPNCNNAGSPSYVLASWWVMGVPVIGPFISGGMIHQELITPLVIIFSGVPQVAGLAMIIAGGKRNFALNKKYERAELRLLPQARPAGSGLVLLGRF
jgi:hypothetical protein